MKKNWFEVSKEGLRQLQEGKSKDSILKELVQNAWDEDGVTFCYVNLHFLKGQLTIVVRDDAPEGFKELSHAFTLFAPTYKRLDPEKRGRFNIGEKQVLSMCQKAIIVTTKGSIIFDETGRHCGRSKTKKGSTVTISLRMKQSEFQSMLNSAYTYLPPKGIRFDINTDIIPYRKPYKTVEAILPTEIQRQDGLVKTIRKTEVDIHKLRISKDEFTAPEKAYLYEMGLPVCEIDCECSVDVQQKIPLSIDRETVSQSYLKKIFTIVLNSFHFEISSENASDVWVREGMSSKEVSDEAVKSVIKARYGNKVVVAAPGDALGKDEAIARGYKIVYGSEMSTDEWENVRKTEAIVSTAIKFPTEMVEGMPVEADKDMMKVAELAKRIAARCLMYSITVDFKSWPGGVKAQYGNRHLTFNVKTLGKGFFQHPVTSRVINLIVHELGHEKGNHTEMAYHQCLSSMAGQLIVIALDEPEFFDLSFSLYRKEA